MTDRATVSPRFSLRAWVNLGITAIRYYGAVISTRGKDTAPLARFRANSSEAIFTIIGPGATLNDLTPVQHSEISAGVSASVNMAALAPIDFDICATEAFVGASDFEAYRVALRRKSRVPLIWHQDRARHENDLVSALDEEFGLYRYRRASVSIRRDLGSFQLAFRRFIAPRVFDKPNLRVSFALTGSIARLTLLGLSLGYRRIRFVGVDLGSTPYFWLENKEVLDKTAVLSRDYVTTSPGAVLQGGTSVVPNFFAFIEEISLLRPDLDFATYDTNRRSRLTLFLETLTHRQK